MNSTDNMLHRSRAEMKSVSHCRSSVLSTACLKRFLWRQAHYQCRAGTLYLHEPEQRLLRFEILRNDTLNTADGGTSGVAITFPPIIFTTRPESQSHNVASHSALSCETVNITEAYTAQGFDFSGTKDLML